VIGGFEMLSRTKSWCLQQFDKMKRHIITAIAFLFIFACNYEQNKSSNKKSIIVDKIRIGMTIQEMKNLYADSEFKD
jgi:hypothetical protein